MMGFKGHWGWVCAAVLVCWALGAQAQFDDADKRLILPGQKPDLELSSFSHKGVFTVGNTITFYWGVRNASTVSMPSGSNWSDCVYISSSKTLGQGAVSLKCVTNREGVPAARGYTRSTSVVLPQMPAGNYFLWMVTDAGEQINEISSDNNYVKYGPVSVALSGKPPVVLPEIRELHISGLGGSDTSGIGTVSQPLRTLDSALQHAATYATPSEPVDVRISSGIYTNSIRVPANVTLLGANPLDPSETVIRPALGDTGTEGAGILVKDTSAVLRDLTLEVDPALKAAGGFPLLKLSNSTVLMDNVKFEGNGKDGSVGLVAQNLPGLGTAMTRCEFVGLERGIEFIGAAPNVSRNVFRNIAGDAITITLVPGVATLPLLGAVGNPASGFNYFENVGGYFINNLTSNLVLAEMNEFGGINFDQLPGFFNGPVDHDPGTVVYSLQSSLFVTVLNDDDSPAPIYDATVNVSPAVLPGLGANIDGVYPFALVPPGNYTITVSAPGFFDTEVEVSVPPNQPITPVTVNMTSDGAEAKFIPLKHNSDADQDDKIDLSELLRVVQLFNAPSLRCLAGTEDGYAPGYGDTASCEPHVADYDKQNWKITLNELLRIIQLFAIGAYHPCESGEDGYCPGLA